MSEPLKIFVSYSRRDKKWLDQLRDHLKPLMRDEQVDVWDDTRIKAGARWKEEIMQALQAAQVAVLLVSRHFLASDFIVDEELQPLLKAAEDEGMLILPVIVGHSNLKHTPSLAAFQAINDPKRPLARLKGWQRDEVFVRLTTRIMETVDARQPAPVVSTLEPEPEKPPTAEAPPPARKKAPPRAKSTPEAPPKVWSKVLNATFVLIPAGSFEMGSEVGEDWEEPVHRVTISKPFYMGVHVVTQGQWKAVMGTEPWKGKKFVQEGEDYPAVSVSWDDAQVFIERLNDKEDAGRYRLPTEAQWEYACRAGSTTDYSFGDDESKLGDYAWYVVNAYDVNEKYAHRVGQKKPNAWGLYDMHGNVCEWVKDWYGSYSSEAVTDPSGPSTGSFRVVRGGCWDSPTWGVLSASRLNGGSNLLRDVDLGFRLVREAEQRRILSFV